MAGKYLKRKINNIAKSVKKIPYSIRRFYNKKRIKSRDFTVISNNCWAGKLYQYLDMPYLSPTVGLYFYADDYMKFIKNLRHYIALDLKFISVEESKHKELIHQRGYFDIPVAELDDIEVIFLHYKTNEEAEEKWTRRKQRINWNHLIFKFSDMNGCTEEHLRDFSELPFPHKFILSERRPVKYDCEYFWKAKNNEDYVLFDTIPFPSNLNLSRIIK